MQIVQLVGPAPQLVGLGMSDAEAQAVGRSLVGRSSTDISAALSAIGEEDKKKVMIAYLAAMGDPKTWEAAIHSASSPLGQTSPWLKTAWAIAAAASMAASAYHGYKRNDSLGWALWWGLMGSLFPIITPTVAVAQGFAKPKRRR